jgi:phospholipid transport system substrate-binding protein
MTGGSRARLRVGGTACCWVIALVAAWHSSASSAAAGAPSEQLKASVDRIIRILEDPGLKADTRTRERRAAIRGEADRIFAFEETAKRALGPHWRGLSEQDRREFVPLFADLLQHSYISKIEQYNGEKITYAGDAVEGDLATVKTRFTTRNGTPVPVDYRMLRRGDQWLVYDVNIEGVSLIANYRTQFNKIIRTDSYQALVAKLRDRQGEFGAPGASTKGAPRS